MPEQRSGAGSSTILQFGNDLTPLKQPALIPDGNYLLRVSVADDAMRDGTGKDGNPYIVVGVKLTVEGHETLAGHAFIESFFVRGSDAYKLGSLGRAVLGPDRLEEKVREHSGDFDVKWLDGGLIYGVVGRRYDKTNAIDRNALLKAMPPATSPGGVVGTALDQVVASPRTRGAGVRRVP